MAEGACHNYNVNENCISYAYVQHISRVCLEPFVMQTTYDNYYDCLQAGYKEAIDKQIEIGRQETNAHQIFIRFSCKPVNEI